MGQKCGKKPLPYPLTRKYLEPCRPSHVHLQDINLTIFFVTNSRYAKFPSCSAFKKPCLARVIQIIEKPQCKARSICPYYGFYEGTPSHISTYSILFLNLRLLRIRSVVPIMARATI